MIRSPTLTMALLLAGPALASDRAPAPAGAAVYFITPTSGERLANPVTVRIGLVRVCYQLAVVLIAAKSVPIRVVIRIERKRVARIARTIAVGVELTRV